MPTDAERFCHGDKALSIHLSFMPFYLWMCRANDNVHGLGTNRDDPRHGLNHMFQPLAAIDESEAADDLPVGKFKSRLWRCPRCRGECQALRAV